MPVTTGIITAGIGLGTTIYGAIQKQKAQKAANANVMPTYQIPQSQNDVLNLAESQAGNGMSAAARQQLQNNANSGLAATLNSQQRNGGDANAMSGAYNNYAEGIDKNAIYDDQARVANLRNLQTQYQNQSAYQDKAWQINDYAPWANRAQAIAGQLQGANQWETSGMNTLLSGLAKTGSALGSSGGGSGVGSQTPDGGGSGQQGSPGAGQPGAPQSPMGGQSGGDGGALTSRNGGWGYGSYPGAYNGGGGSTGFGTLFGGDNNLPYTGFGGGNSSTPFRFDQNPTAGSGNGGFQWNGYYPVSAP